MVKFDSGYVHQTVVKTEGEYPCAVRFLANSLDRQQEGDINLSFYDEPSLAAWAAKVEKFRAPNITMLEDTAHSESSQIGAVERAHRTCDSQLRALRLNVCGRTEQDVVPGHVMFPWMVRYGPFCLNRLQPRGQLGQTIFEGVNGYHCKSILVPSLEQVMIRVPIDPPGYRKKLDSQWLKGVWVGRASDSDALVVIHPEGIVAGKSVRRLAPENRHDVELYKLISGPRAWKCGI